MKSNKLLLIFILIETFTLFCLGVLGDRLASLITIPTWLLLGFTALGIAMASIIAFLRQSPPENLSLGEAWQRLKPKKRRRIMFGPRYSERKELWLINLGLFGPLVLGILGAFIYPYFLKAGLITQWYWLLGGFVLLTLIPNVLLYRQSYSVEIWGDTFFGVGCMMVVLTALVFSGVGVGISIVYIIWPTIQAIVRDILWNCSTYSASRLDTLPHLLSYIPESN